jgi:hypothetical protein
MGPWEITLGSFDQKIDFVTNYFKLVVPMSSNASSTTRVGNMISYSPLQLFGGAENSSITSLVITRKHTIMK